MSMVATIGVGGTVALAGSAASAGASAAGAASSSAASHEAAKQQMYATALQMQNNANALKAYRKSITPYMDIGTSNIPGYQSALNQYTSQLPGYQSELAKYQSAVDAYQAAQNEYKNQGVSAISDAANLYKNAIPEMTAAYGMDQYKNSPLYTPMVNNLSLIHI